MTDDKSWVSVEEAAKRLGVSGATVRRRVRDGTLEGYREQRPQGEVYRVLSSALPPDSQVPPPDTQESVSPDTQPRADLDRALGILDASLQLTSKTMYMQAEQIAALREERGRLQAERDAAVARAKQAEQQADEERALSRELEFKIACAETRAAELERQLEQARPWRRWRWGWWRGT